MPPFDLEPLVLDALLEAVIVTSPQGVIVRWNKAAERLYGWTAEETLGRNISDVTVPAEGQDEAERIMEQLRRGESWTGDFLVQRRDRSTFRARVTDTAILDEKKNIVAIIGVSQTLPQLEVVMPLEKAG